MASTSPAPVLDFEDAPASASPASPASLDTPASPTSPASLALPAWEENDPFTDRIECSAITIADVLRTDIMQLSCLQCTGATEQDSPCYATIHPFCDLFHRWISDRLGADRSQHRCQLPSQVLAANWGGRAAASVGQQLESDGSRLSDAEIARLCGDFDAAHVYGSEGEDEEGEEEEGAGAGSAGSTGSEGSAGSAGASEKEEEEEDDEEEAEEEGGCLGGEELDAVEEVAETAEAAEGGAAGAARQADPHEDSSTQAQTSAQTSAQAQISQNQAQTSGSLPSGRSTTEADAVGERLAAAAVAAAAVATAAVAAAAVAAAAVATAAAAAAVVAAVAAAAAMATVEAAIPSLVEALEAHVGEPKEQQQALREGLRLLATALALPAESVPLSLEEIYSWRVSVRVRLRSTPGALGGHTHAHAHAHAHEQRTA